jgi:hypothetical protein
MHLHRFATIDASAPSTGSSRNVETILVPRFALLLPRSRLANRNLFFVDETTVAVRIAARLWLQN